jgi:hypothetical protein
MQNITAVRSAERKFSDQCKFHEYIFLADVQRLDQLPAVDITRSYKRAKSLPREIARELGFNIERSFTHLLDDCGGIRRTTLRGLHNLNKHGTAKQAIAVFKASLYALLRLHAIFIDSIWRLNSFQGGSFDLVYYNYTCRLCYY